MVERAADGGRTTTGGERDSRPVQPLEWLRSLPPPDRLYLPPRHYVVMVRLALAMKPDGSGWVARERLADEAAVSTDTVDRAIKKAIASGFLLRTSRGHRLGNGTGWASTYQLCVAEVNSALVCGLETDLKSAKRDLNSAK